MKMGMMSETREKLERVGAKWTTTHEGTIELHPRAYGIEDMGDSLSYVWAVFTRAAVEAVHGEVTPENIDDIASALTGWSEFSRGPGRAFGDAPSVRLFRHALLIRRRCGLDI